MGRLFGRTFLEKNNAKPKETMIDPRKNIIRYKTLVLVLDKFSLKRRVKKFMGLWARKGPAVKKSSIKKPM